MYIYVFLEYLLYLYVYIHAFLDIQTHMHILHSASTKKI